MVSNWSHTALCKTHDFVEEEDGESVGRQYPTDTGPIDILAQSKEGAVSTRGSNVPVEEWFLEDFAGGVEAEGLSGSVARFVGDGVEVGLVAGDLDALG